MDEITTFGAWLKRRRKSLDLTQKELADQIGCSMAAIQKIEGEERRPSRQVADLLAGALKISKAERDSFIKVARGSRMTSWMANPAEPMPGSRRSS